MTCLTNTNICRIRGDTNSILVTVTSDGSTPIDITGDSFLLTVDPEEAPSDNTNNLFQITGVIVDAANGQVSFTPSTANADQTPGIYYYDVQRTASGGEIRTILRGEWEVTQDITK